MTLFVLDASVAAKWFLPRQNEPLTSEALALYEKYLRGEIGFIVPDLFWVELASAFWKAIRLSRFEKTSAQEAITYLRRCELPAFAATALIDRAFQIATAFDRSVYDSLYVALAEHSHCQLITADERLANALAAYFPIQWLGAL